MSATCANHPDRAAAHVATMPIATRPYKGPVYLCSECGPRVLAIGFEVHEYPIKAAGR